MPMQFRALKNFDAPETGSSYVAGLTYTVREGNMKLAGLVEKWRAAKMVELVGERPAVPVAKVGGQGKVK